MKFDETIGSGEVVLVDFWASWCMPCRMMHGVIEEISKSHKVLKINIDDDEGRNISMKYGIDAVPTFIVFKDGKPERKLVGLQNKEVLMEALRV